MVRILIIAIVCVVLCGCLTSGAPVYTPDQVVTPLPESAVFTLCSPRDNVSCVSHGNYTIRRTVGNAYSLQWIDNNNPETLNTELIRFFHANINISHNKRAFFISFFIGSEYIYGLIIFDDSTNEILIYPPTYVPTSDNDQQTQELAREFFARIEAAGIRRLSGDQYRNYSIDNYGQLVSYGAILLQYPAYTLRPLE